MRQGVNEILILVARQTFAKILVAVMKAFSSRNRLAEDGMDLRQKH
jgi:hypothetical protein